MYSDCNKQYILEFGVYSIPYTIVHSDRYSRICLVFDPSLGALVKVPLGVGEHKAHAFVKKNSSWLFKHWKRYERIKMMHKDHLLPLNQRSEVLYLGRSLPFKVVLGHEGRVLVGFDGERLKIECFDEKELMRLLDRWYRQQARAVIHATLMRLAPLLKITYEDVLIKDQKTRWGSCSSSGNLSFNWRLIKAPMDVLEYVVVHELAHRKEMNHSQKFWSIVSRYSPDYKKHQKWLKGNVVLLRS